MRWEKIFAIAVLLYLAIALPLYYFNEKAIGQCTPVCSSQGFDTTLGAAQSGDSLMCRCLNTTTRQEQFIPAG